MKTDTSEIGLESLIVGQMTGRHGRATVEGFDDKPEPLVGLYYWILGNPQDYDRAFTMDLVQLRASSVTAATRRRTRSISRCSSMACRSRRSSSRTA
jgi:hypothetical protein